MEEKISPLIDLKGTIEWLKHNGKWILSSAITLIVAFFGFTVNWKNSDNDFTTIKADNFQKLYNQQESQINRLELKLDKISQENEVLQTQVNELQISQIKNNQNQLLFANSIDNLPFPYWVKSKEGRMILLNKAFEDRYLISKGLTRLDYIDKTDYDVWSAKEALSFRQADLNVMRKKIPIANVEIIEINGKRVRLEVLKFPIFFNKEVIGVGGIVYPKEF